MTSRPAETTRLHTRLLKCALEVEDCRCYWARVGAPREGITHQAFDEYWFGARSLPRVSNLLRNMRARFDAFPQALSVLHRWREMEPDTRRVICHWHLQLADPLYRRFTGTFLAERREEARPGLTRDRVVTWVARQDADRWNASTRIQFASKLLSAASAAGLVATTRNPRELSLPRVPDEALAYLLHLLRGVDYQGTLLDNPYLGSVGLGGAALSDRLRRLSDVGFRQQGDLVDLDFDHADLAAWADATLPEAA